MKYVQRLSFILTNSKNLFQILDTCRTLFKKAYLRNLKLCFAEPSFTLHRRDGVVVRVSSSQSVDLAFISLVKSIHSFPVWRSAFRGGCGEQAGKFASCVVGQGT